MRRERRGRGRADREGGLGTLGTNRSTLASLPFKHADPGEARSRAGPIGRRARTWLFRDMKHRIGSQSSPSPDFAGNCFHCNPANHRNSPGLNAKTSTWPIFSPTPDQPHLPPSSSLPAVFSREGPEKCRDAIGPLGAFVESAGCHASHRSGS